MSDEDFRRHFRMVPATFLRLVEYCEARYRPAPEDHENGGREPMSVLEMVFITLWYLANQCVLREISVRFNRTISAVWQAIDRITGLLEEHQEDFIKWPTLEEAPNVAAIFMRRTGVPGVVGSIDGCHIKIDSPKENEKDYVNRKFFHSINVLAVCTHNRKFSYILVGFPGSVHDARVFRCSDLFTQISTDPAVLFPSTNYHLIGDAAFPCSRYLLPTFKKTLANTPRKKRYNKKISRTRIVVENAFSDVKMIWRRMLHVKTNVTRAVKIITSCMALHNFLIDNRERAVCYREIADYERINYANDLADDRFANMNGMAKRNELVNLLW